MPDPEDPDSRKNAPVEEDEEEVPVLPPPGNISSSHPLRDWPDDGESEDDYVILEVFDPMPSAFTFPLDDPGVDPDDLVINAVPIRQEQGVAPKPKSRKKKITRRNVKPKGPPTMPTGPVPAEGGDPMETG